MKKMSRLSVRTLFSLAQFSIFLLLTSSETVADLASDDYLSLGDEALSIELNEQAIGFYNQGIAALTEDKTLLTALSLHTNLATAFSSVGNNEEAVTHYQEAIAVFSREIDEIVDKEMKKYAVDITSHASIFLGMVFQDLGEAQRAVDAYIYAVDLDPYHWAAVANLGSVLHDDLRLHDEALEAYNKAFGILTQTDVEPTDPPVEPRFILSQLQYRIGLCLNHDFHRKCAVKDDHGTPVPCIEMAAHAFSLAVQYDSDNESAKHMLATVTADATMNRASNTYVKSLFDNYAHK
jgi:tetratricopeptide (TPR) repeat protein